MNVVNAGNDEVKGCHQDQYLQWYRRITRNRIGWPLQRVHLDQDSSTQQKVDRFLDWQLGKVEMFKKAWSSGFVSINVENCINSTFDEEGKVDVRSPSPNTPVGSRDGVYGLSPDPHTSTHMFHSSHSTMTPIHVSTPQSVRSQIPVNLSTPKVQVDFLRKKFLNIGWCDPMFWNFEIGNPNPHQTNNFDCGIFTMANAEHAACQRAIEYTQADIWYY
ncbi:hypothetical protein MRB53_002368 [Persea americana]|uniref:Uncharacterized protein n=1 Tax=Persea americana TaxID=3435 RepID=A0ACC2MUB6_PERAE|nr:hypothetical protein MRB53_002368 [Persea americana]